MVAFRAQRLHVATGCGCPIALVKCRHAVAPDNLKQAAAITALFAHHVAMREERLPRKPLTVREERSGRATAPAAVA